MRFLLDTNVLSELRKRACNPHVRTWYEPIDEANVLLSVLVIGEIRRGIDLVSARDPKKAAVFERWLKTTVRTRWAGRILPVTEAVAEAWGRLDAESPISKIDGLLAATALVHDLTLVTRNTKDVARTGVSVLNPFEPAGTQ